LVQKEIKWQTIRENNATKTYDIYTFEIDVALAEGWSEEACYRQDTQLARGKDITAHKILLGKSQITFIYTPVLCYRQEYESEYEMLVCVSHCINFLKVANKKTIPNKA
jgi:hypothetical protein